MLVVINGAEAVALAGGDTLRCGRLRDAGEGIVGLDPLDRAISRRALEIACTGTGWTVTNTSRTQLLHVDRTTGGPLLPLPPGAVHVIDRHTSSIEVRGAIRTHRIDFLLRYETPTLGPLDPVFDEVDTVTETVELSDNERVALVALFRGYLERFPRRDCEPLSYADAAASVGVSPTALRRRVERVRDRLRRSGTYLEGFSAKHQLATFLLEREILRPEDLELLGSDR